MKKSALFLFLAFFYSFQSNAQTEKGTGFIGLNFDNIWSLRSGKLTGGAFVADNFSIGLNTNIGLGRNINGDDVSGSNLNLGGGLFGRYHFGNIGQDFRPFVQAEAGLNRYRKNGNWRGAEFTGIGGGFVYFISPEFSIEASTNIRASNHNDGVNIHLGDWDIGVKYYFGKQVK